MTSKGLKSQDKSCSGKFVLRISPQLHEDLKHRAQTRGLSLNELCVSHLKGARMSGEKSDDPLLSAIVNEFEDKGLVGVCLFGSASRDELSERSDIDLLLVMDGPVERGLYRNWDDSASVQSNARVGAHPVNPQFVRLPSDVSSVGGIWLETAIEGRVLWDPELKVHRALTEIRRAISEGQFTRAFSHGHPFWKRKTG